MNQRPKTLEEIHGQDHLKEQIKIAVSAAKKRNDAIGHVLLSGPPGCGKTTIAGVLAQERGVDFLSVIATSIKTEDDLKEILASQLNSEGYRQDDPDPVDPTMIKPTVLFIDEIHNLKPKVYETLYTVMEDRIYWEDQKNPWSQRTQKRKTWVPKFTLVGATTKEGILEKPFLDRFVYQWKVKKYSREECKKFVKDTLNFEGIGGTEDAVEGVAQRSRGTARVAIQLTRQCIDVCVSRTEPALTREIVEEYFKIAGIDKQGLSEIDRKILFYLYEANRAIGLKAIATYVEEASSSLETHYEPYLVSLGFIGRTPRGRAITEAGVDYLRSCGLVTTSNRRYF